MMSCRTHSLRSYNGQYLTYSLLVINSLNTVPHPVVYSIHLFFLADVGSCWLRQGLDVREFQGLSHYTNDHLNCFKARLVIRWCSLKSYMYRMMMIRKWRLCRMFRYVVKHWTWNGMEQWNGIWNGLWNGFSSQNSADGYKTYTCTKAQRLEKA